MQQQRERPDWNSDSKGKLLREGREQRLGWATNKCMAAADSILGLIHKLISLAKFPIPHLLFLPFSLLWSLRASPCSFPYVSLPPLR